MLSSWFLRQCDETEILLYRIPSICLIGADAGQVPVLDPAEDVFDLVALAVEVLFIMVLDLAVFAGRDAWGDALRDQRGAEPGAVIAFVREQFLGAGPPADVYFVRGPAILAQRAQIKRQTIEHRRLQHRKLAA